MVLQCRVGYPNVGSWGLGAALLCVAPNRELEVVYDQKVFVFERDLGLIPQCHVRT